MFVLVRENNFKFGEEHIIFILFFLSTTVINLLKKTAVVKIFDAVMLLDLNAQ